VCSHDYCEILSKHEQDESVPTRLLSITQFPYLALYAFFAAISHNYVLLPESRFFSVPFLKSEDVGELLKTYSLVCESYLLV
jgi:hypothetical protein